MIVELYERCRCVQITDENFEAVRAIIEKDRPADANWRCERVGDYLAIYSDDGFCPPKIGCSYVLPEGSVGLNRVVAKVGDWIVEHLASDTIKFYGGDDFASKFTEIESQENFAS